MSLQKQVVPVLFNVGIDTKTHKFTLQGGLLELENAYWQSANELRKRSGYSAFSTDVTPTGAIASARKLANFNQELTLIGENSIHTYSPGSEKWISKGEIVPLSISTENIIANSYEQTSVDSASANGITVYCWEDSRGGVRASVLDTSSRTAIVPDVEMSATGSRAKVIAAGSYLFVFYVESTSLKVKRINALSPSAFESAVTIGTNVNASTPIFDVCGIGANMVVAYRDNSSTISIAYFMQDNVVGSTIYGVPNASTISADADKSITIFPGVGDTFWVVYAHSVNGLKCIGMNNNFSTYKSAVTLDAYVTTDIRNVTGWALSDTLTVFYEIAAASNINTLVKKQTLTISTNTAGTASTFCRSVGLASKVFTYDSDYFVQVAYPSTTQATYFTVRDDGFIAAKSLPNVAGGLSAKLSHIPSVNSLSSSEFFVAGLKKTKLISENADIFSLRGVAEIAIEFSSTLSADNAQLGQNLHIAGGFLKMYDGYSTVEHGFHHYPEVPSSATSSTGGSISDGTYLYKVVFEWTDAKGQIHQSSPSTPLTVTHAAGTTTQKTTLTIPTLRLTSKCAAQGRTEVSLAVYRTVTAGTVYYRVSSVTSPTYNSTTADTISFEDTLADSAITSNQILYTVGNAVEHISPPPCNLVRSYKNRLVVAGLENSNEWWVSKEHVAGQGAAFSDLLSYTIDPTGGGITALAEMDDKLIFFKESAIFATFGDGPSDTGQGGYSIPELFSTDVGCTEPESIVRVPDGIMFKSNKGIYLLTRNLQTAYLGAPVEAYNSLNITGAVLIDDKNQVRFTTSEGRTLVYDYFFKQWSTFTNQEAVSCIIWNNQFVFARSDGTVCYEREGFYFDINQTISTKIVTNWFSFAGLQGYQRIYSGMLLGEYQGTHTLKVTVYNDFREFETESFTTQPSSSIYGGSFGSSATWGSDSVWGGTQGYDGVYQFKFQPKQQKCQSVKIKIEDLFSDGTGTASFSMNALSFEVGVIPGSNRLPSNKKMS